MGLALTSPFSCVNLLQYFKISHLQVISTYSISAPPSFQEISVIMHISTFSHLCLIYLPLNISTSVSPGFMFSSLDFSVSSTAFLDSSRSQETWLQMFCNQHCMKGRNLFQIYWSKMWLQEEFWPINVRKKTPNSLYVLRECIWQEHRVQWKLIELACIKHL